jgi:hypothetical protein
MRDTAGKNRPKVSELAVFAKENKVDLSTVELDVGSQESADDAIRTIMAGRGALMLSFTTPAI